MGRSANAKSCPASCRRRRRRPARSAATRCWRPTCSGALRAEPISTDALRLKLLTNLELAKVLGGLDQPLPHGRGNCRRAGRCGRSDTSCQPGAGRRAASTAAFRPRSPRRKCSAQIGDAACSADQGWPRPARWPRRCCIPIAASGWLPRWPPCKLEPGESLPRRQPRARYARLGFAGTSGQSLVLVGHPRGEEAQTLVGFMNDLATKAKRLYRPLLAELAFANPDYEFILISDAIDCRR